MDVNYWNNYYNKESSINSPSSFAKFCLEEKHLKRDMNLIEIGCGNGRDAKYFAANDIFVRAIDQSKTIIKNNNIERSTFAHKSNVKFYQENFVEFISEFSEVDSVYSRFSIHSINEKQQNIVFQKVYNILKKGGVFLIECRTNKDPLLQRGKKISDSENFTDHYRRYIDSSKVKEYLSNKIGFNIQYFLESNNLSVYQDDNPVLARFVLMK